jgi:hypothetical protein
MLGKRRDGLNIYCGIADERVTLTCGPVRPTIRQRLHRRNRILGLSCLIT